MNDLYSTVKIKSISICKKILKYTRVVVIVLPDDSGGQILRLLVRLGIRYWLGLDIERQGLAAHIPYSDHQTISNLPSKFCGRIQNSPVARPRVETLGVQGK